MAGEFAIRGRILLGETLVEGVLVVRDGCVVAIDRSGLAPAMETLDADVIAPGLIDLQVNGAFGHEVGESADAYVQLAAALPCTGVTAYLPTLVSSPPAYYRGALDAFDRARDAPGARAVGLHLEGPLLAPSRAGAHRRDVIESARYEDIAPLVEHGAVKLVTLAPERAGALDAIEALTTRGVVTSLGHTEATYDQFTAGIARGATMATHVFNAMSALGHRAPGAVGAALSDDRVTVGLIVDGVHCHPAVARIVLRAKGVARVALVTDAMAAAGVGPGTFALGAQRVTVERDAARLDDGTLAGSVLTLDRAVRNAVSLAGASVEDALRMATEVPARVLGRDDIGRIAVGGAADLVLFDRAMEVLATVIAGRVVYRRPQAVAPAVGSP